MGWGQLEGNTIGKTIFKCVFKSKMIKEISSRSAAPEEINFT
jgi:hypothetical protein